METYSVDRLAGERKGEGLAKRCAKEYLIKIPYYRIPYKIPLTGIPWYATAYCGMPTLHRSVTVTVAYPSYYLAKGTLRNEGRRNGRGHAISVLLRARARARPLSLVCASLVCASVYVCPVPRVRRILRSSGSGKWH